MDIQSAFNSGIQGFQKATETANEAATNIVAQTSARENEELSTQAVNATGTTNETHTQTQSSSEVPSLTQSVVDLKVAEYQAKASANVINTADEALGTLLDVRA